MSGIKSKVTVKTMSFKNEIVDKIESEAKKQNRSVSNFVETILIKHFDKNE